MDKEDIRIIDLLSLALRRWRFTFAITFLASIAAIIISLSIPNQYKSFTVISSTDSTINQSGSAFGGLGTLGNALGLNFSEVDDAKVAKAIEILKSQNFILSFIKKYNLEPMLLAVKGYDPKKNQLVYDKAIFDNEKNQWGKNFFGRIFVPNDEMLYERFSGMLIVDSETKRNFINISITFFTPSDSKKILTDLMFELDKFLREKQQKISEMSVKSLVEKINQTSDQSLKTTYFAILEEYIKEQDLASTSYEHIFTVIEPPTLPISKSLPLRSLIVIFTFLIAFFLSALVSVTIPGNIYRKLPRIIRS